jgi:ribosome recycling factor
VTAEEFATVRTGRASPQLLEKLSVSYYGTMTPLNQIATVSAPEARMLIIQPYDRNAIGEIEKAITQSDLGFVPSDDGQVIRVPIPQLTEERRKDLGKMVRAKAEEGRVAVRNVRRDADKALREEEKHIKEIDELMEKKIKELMEI